MKTFKRWIPLAATGLLLAACGTDEEETVEPGTEEEQPEEAPELEQETDETDEETEDADVSQDVAAWLPPLENTQYIYEGDGSEYAGFDVVSQYAEEDAWQTVEHTSGTSLVTVYEYSEEEVRRVYSREETYFRENFIDSDMRNEEEEILIQAPIEEGHSWESPNGDVYEITGVNVPVETASGSYNAIEVSRSTSEDGEAYMIRYYAENIGLVEQVTVTEEEVVSSLAEIQEDQEEVIPLMVYTVDDQAMGLDAVETELTLPTNEEPNDALAEALTQAEGSALPEGLTINDLSLNGEVAEVDFSEELSDLQAGSGAEALIIQGLVNTIGEYYHTDEVLVTVDGEPYSSGHVELQEGETFPVDPGIVNDVE